mgnify:CR=1 FL=1
MDRNTIKKEIIALASSIKIQSDTLANEKYPSQLDLELFLHKVEKLYQKSIVFNHLSVFDGFEESDAAIQSATIAASQEKKGTVPEPILATITDVETSRNIPPVVPAAEPKHDPVVPAAKERTQEPKQEKKEERTGSGTPKATIADLKSTIGINDKFQFTNELFKGNMQEFNIAIEQLNASETKDSALSYLSGMKQLYGWDEEHETVKRLLNLVERRYN